MFEKCPICNGTGKDFLGCKCTVCNGKKIISSLTGLPPVNFTEIKPIELKNLSNLNNCK